MPNIDIIPEYRFLINLKSDGFSAIFLGIPSKNGWGHQIWIANTAAMQYTTFIKHLQIAACRAAKNMSVTDWRNVYEHGTGDPGSGGIPEEF